MWYGAARGRAHVAAIAGGVHAVPRSLAHGARRTTAFILPRNSQLLYVPTEDIYSHNLRSVFREYLSITISVSVHK